MLKMGRLWHQLTGLIESNIDGPLFRTPDGRLEEVRCPLHRAFFFLFFVGEFLVVSLLCAADG